MPREARFNQKDYTHYVVVSRGGVPFIESGWSYAEDAQEQRTNGNLPDGVKSKVVTKMGLKRAGVDPDDNKNWLRGQWWLETEPGRPGQKFSHGDVEIETTLHPVKGFGEVSPRGGNPRSRGMRPTKGALDRARAETLVLRAKADADFAARRVGPGKSCCREPKVLGGRCDNCGTWLTDQAKTQDLDGVSPRTRFGTRVMFAPNPASHLLYSNPPEVGEKGSVTYMPGYKPKTFFKGPGGGLLYVEWDKLGVMGVSPNDVVKAGATDSYKQYRREGLGDSGKAISDHKIEDHGVEHEQYFQGCGISHTKWDEVASGVGSTPMEAYEDALDSLAQNGWDVESLPQDGEGLSKKSEIPPNEPIGYNPSGYSEDLHHYVCVYVKG